MHYLTTLYWDKNKLSIATKLEPILAIYSERMTTINQSSTEREIKAVVALTCLRHKHPGYTLDTTLVCQ